MILAVIGILLALQINTWSRDREERMEEHQLLLRHEKELEEDLQNIEEVKDRYEARVVLSLVVLDSIGENNAKYVRQWPCHGWRDLVGGQSDTGEIWEITFDPPRRKGYPPCFQNEAMPEARPSPCHPDRLIP